ncbi:MAG: AAA family ATPase [Phycisphaerae bacterium]|nr:AAA family ATPase [Saprospiraceae bacterium]
MENLLAKSAALVQRTSENYHRYLFGQVRWDNRLIGIKGARGTGKTTLLLQRLKSMQALPTQAAYFSLDDLYFTQNHFSKTVEQFYREGGKTVFLDEVHKYPGWAIEVKNLHDFYPDLNIVFTGSSIVDLAKEEGDLSRRVLMYELQGLSFREFLDLEGVARLPVLSLEQLTDHSKDLASAFPVDFRPLERFKEYLSRGYYPFFREDREGFHQRLQQLVRTVVEYDMSALKGFDPRNARKLLQLLYILSANVPYYPNLTQLAHKADIHRNSVLNYLLYLEQARLIRLVSPEGRGLSLLQKPEKIYLNNPNLAFALAGESTNPGTLRETFFASQVGAVHRLTAPPKGDFKVDERWLFEIGGVNKTHQQIADLPESFVVRDGLEFPVGKSLPLWMFGCLY